MARPEDNDTPLCRPTAPAILPQSGGPLPPFVRLTHFPSSFMA
jgi:hypothetical protein